MALVTVLRHYGDKIYLYTAIQRKTLYISLKISAPDKYWNLNTGLVKNTHPNADVMNNKIVSEKNKLERLIIENPSLDRQRLRDLYQDIKKKNNKITLIEFAKQFHQECIEGKHKRSLGVIKYYNSRINIIEKYIAAGNKFDFENINKEAYDSFIGWLRNGNTRDIENRVPLNENTVGNYIKFIKMILREARERGLYDGDEYQKKYFKQPSQETDSIYLNKEDIESIINLNLSSYPHLIVERDRFIVQYYLVLRHSDCVRISEGNFFKKEGIIYYKVLSQKTATHTQVPVKPIVYDICKKYNFSFANDTLQESNRKLKLIAQLAGMIDPVTVHKETVPKFMLVSTHTARRSAATNLYLDGVHEKIIMDLGGWKDIQTLRKYIRISQLQSAEIASKIEFFT